MSTQEHADATVTAILNDVAADTNAHSSAVSVIRALAERVREAKENPDQVDYIATAIHTQADELAAAIFTNTAVAMAASSDQQKYAADRIAARERDQNRTRR